MIPKEASKLIDRIRTTSHKLRKARELMRTLSASRDDLTLELARAMFPGWVERVRDDGEETPGTITPDGWEVTGFWYEWGNEEFVAVAYLRRDTPQGDERKVERRPIETVTLENLHHGAW
jgi:hypothetical protein